MSLTFAEVWPWPKASCLLPTQDNMQVGEQTLRRDDERGCRSGWIRIGPLSTSAGSYRRLDAKRWAAKQPSSPFEGFINESPRLCRGMVNGKPYKGNLSMEKG